jgi:hypothetical protein
MNWYLVGRTRIYGWEFVGLYTSQEIALGFCEDETFFISPVSFQVLPPDQQQPDVCYYPLLVVEKPKGKK